MSEQDQSAPKWEIPMPDDADTGQWPESLWGLDWKQNRFLWTLHQKTLDQVIMEDSIDMGAIKSPGYSSLPAGFVTFLEEEQNIHKCSQSRISLSGGMLGLSIFLQWPQTKELMTLQAQLTKMVGQDQDPHYTRLKQLEDNTGKFNYVEESPHSMSIALPEATEGIRSRMAKAMGIHSNTFQLLLIVIAFDSVGNTDSWGRRMAEEVVGVKHRMELRIKGYRGDKV